MLTGSTANKDRLNMANNFNDGDLLQVDFKVSLDDILEEYNALATDFSIEEKGSLNERLKIDNPMLIKKLVSKNIITQYHSEIEAEQAEEFFINQFQK